LFKKLCIIRPVVFLAGPQQSAVLEHWHPVLFQVADSSPILVPYLASSLVFVPLPEPNLLLWAASIALCLAVQIVSAVFHGPVCLYLRGETVPACYSFGGPGERYFHAGNLYRLYPAFLGLYLAILFRLCRILAHAVLPYPGV
jgi:hypothetical protein